LIEISGGKELYLVAPALRDEVADEVVYKPFCLYTTIDRANNLFLWPIRLPGADGKSNAWWDSAHAGAQSAQTDWVRVKANSVANSYDVAVALGNLSAPQWPDYTLAELLQRAFAQHYIDTQDHLVLRRLRREV
jgi:hypothetical protein